jgi:hypothetical protein
MKLDEKNQIIKEEVIIKINFLDNIRPELNEYYIKNLIIPASASRDWMTEEKQRYSYHCLPMVAASQMGWDILSPQDLVIYWNGGNSVKDVSILDVANKKSAKYEGVETYGSAVSHFPVGIVSFSFPFIITTPPGWGIWVSGPSNLWIDGMSPLQGIVETNWLPFSFTMNWKITEKNKPIRIPLHFPICKIIPFPLNLNEKSEIAHENLDMNSSLGKAYTEYSASRTEYNKKIDKREDSAKAGNQKFYKNGTDASGCPYKGLHKLFYKYKKP